MVHGRACTVHMERIYTFILPHLQPLKVTPAEFTHIHESYTSLTTAGDKATAEQNEVARYGASHKFLLVDGLPFRECVVSIDKES